MGWILQHPAPPRMQSVLPAGVLLQTYEPLPKQERPLMKKDSGYGADYEQKLSFHLHDGTINRVCSEEHSFLTGIYHPAWFCLHGALLGWVLFTTKLLCDGFPTNVSLYSTS